MTTIQHAPAIGSGEASDKSHIKPQVQHSPLANRPADPIVGERHEHESAVAHVTGAALYTDDLVGRLSGVLHAHPVQITQYAHARVLGIDTSAALAVPGVVRVLTAADVPGVNDAGVKHDEPLFPDTVRYMGHSVAWVLGESLEAARLGALAVKVELEPLDSIVTIREAIAAGSFQGNQPVLVRGDVDDALRGAAHVFSGELEFGGQEQFYLETNASLASLDEEGRLFVQCSTQHPTETQAIVSHVLGIEAGDIAVQCLRMGGGFGGKEMQPHGYAAIAALGATLTGRPVRLRLTRAQDITMTGKRHPFLVEWQAGFDDEGRILGLRATLTEDGGWSLDLSEPVLARALCHTDNAYNIPNAEFRGRIAKTNKTSQTAFRGFGGPQGILLIEDLLSRVAPKLGLTPEEIRRRNFYRPGDSTPYEQPVKDAERMGIIWDQLHEKASIEARRAEIEAFNREHADVKRGLAVTPVKFGVSFNFKAYNQAGSLVLVYRDGSVLINHGGTEMGQGLHTKMKQVAATALGLPYESIRVAPTRTDKVPNTSATAASTGADLNGGAVKNACETIIGRLRPVAAQLLGGAEEDVRFERGLVFLEGRADAAIPFVQVTEAAYMARIQMSASGFYRTEGLEWDPTVFKGTPFKYFAFGAAATEVEVDVFTGAYTTRRVDIVHDVGDSLSPLIDVGQIEGGFVQGTGWVTLEDLRWDASDRPTRGRLTTQSASTYKVPSFSEMPEEFNVHLFEMATESGAVYGSKAVGEPPLPLGISTREALRQAIMAAGPEAHSVHFGCPATPEAVFWGLREAEQASASAAVASTSASAEGAPASS